MIQVSPARRARLCIARHVGRRDAGRRRMRANGDRRDQQTCSPLVRRRVHSRRRHRPVRARRHAARGSSFLGAQRSRDGDRQTLRRADRRRGLPRKWVSARFRTPCSLSSAATRISASIPRCSPTACSRWSESGVINGRNKAIDKGKMVSTFLMGSQKGIRLHRQQPRRRHDGCRLYERPVRNRQEPESDGDQLGPCRST